MSVCLCLAKSWSVGSKPSHLSQSLCGNVFVCWNKTPRIDMLCWIKTAPASVVLCNFLSAAMRACSCSFVIMAASVRHNLKFGISEFRCVASPAPARAFVPARGSQVLSISSAPCSPRPQKIRGAAARQRGKERHGGDPQQQDVWRAWRVRTLHPVLFGCLWLKGQDQHVDDLLRCMELWAQRSSHPKAPSRPLAP